MIKIKNIYISIFFLTLLIILTSCSSKDFYEVEKGTYFGTLDDNIPWYVKYENDKLYTSIGGKYFIVYSKEEDFVTKEDEKGKKTHSILFKYNREETAKLKNGGSTEVGKEPFIYIHATFFDIDAEKSTNPSLITFFKDDIVIDPSNSKMAIAEVNKIESYEFPEIIFNDDIPDKVKNESNESNVNNFNKETAQKDNEPIIKYENEIIYRLDGIASKYTYNSLLVKNAIKEATKLSDYSIKNNYIVQENEIGQLGITIYSQEIQDEVVENYIFDPYTKKITIREEYSPDNLESVSMIINEAISVIKQETIYGNQPGYIMDGYVTDDGYIAVDINISDNNSGEIIKQDQAVYNPETHLIKEFPKNSPTTSNNDVNENSIIKEAISIVEEKTGYIEGSPYVYEAYENEEDGSVVVEVRSAGAGTMSIVDRFKYLSDTNDVYIYDTPSNSYNPY